MRNDLKQSIEALWAQLLQEEMGVMHKLDYVKAPFYLMASQNVKSFLFVVPSDKKVDILPQKYENVEIQLLPLTKELRGITVSLTNGRLYSVFLVITCDIASALCDCSSDEIALSAFCRKINQWKSVFNKKYESILTPEQQLGLFGELTFLQELINSGVNASEALSSWRGAIKDDKDFLLGPNAVEIKSSTKSDKIVSISNIRQLDSSGFDYLFLYHYTFVRAAEGPTTLPALIQSLRDTFVMMPNPDEFEEKLICAGYFDKDSEHYSKSYTLTNEDSYLVEGDFPRITSSNVMKNVLDAAYTIDLNAAAKHLLSFQDFKQYFIHE